MKHFLRLTDYTKADIYEIFHITDEILEGHYQNLLQGKSVVLFFPESSIRTRVTFEKGIALLGGQPILFPSSALDKKEDLRDVVGYLNSWADLLVVRHRNMAVLEKIAASASVPVINALTDKPHDVFMVGHNGLRLFAEHVHFAVCHKVADQFGAFHAEWHKTVSLSDWSHAKVVANLVGIKACHFLASWHREIFCGWCMSCVYVWKGLHRHIRSDY